MFRVSEAKKTGDFSLLNTESKEYALKRMFIPAESKKVGQRIAESENGGLMAHGNAGAAAFVHASDEAVDKVRKAYECEVHIMSQLPHCDNLVGILDQQEHQRLDGLEVYILLEYCANGTLFDLIESKCKLGLDGISDEAELYKILNDISNGLRLLHGKSVAHRDLKLENVLLGADSNWKICDFGSCTTQ